MPRMLFENELEQLNVELIKMGALIEEAIENSINAFKNKDYTLAKDVIKKDRAIDDSKKFIEGKCLSLILRQQPVAKDLRAVSSALKMVTDMERIGDHASDISEIVLRLKEEHPYTIVEHIPEMADISKNMVHNSVSSFVNGDIHKAKEVIKNDDKVDELFRKAVKEVAEILKSTTETDTDKIDMSIDFLMIAKYLEKIGDHAENICEWIEFNETGEYKNSKMI